MNHSLLEKFLSGNATDTERQQIETLLSESGTVIDESVLANSDSLLEAIQRSATESSDGGAVDESEDERRRAALVQRIQSLIPRQAIGKDELERLLDAPQQDDELGRISRFRVLEFVACGGMGLVFKADDPQLNRDVCIKIMNPALAVQADAKQRFEREARAAARLQSERIVTVLEVGEHRELPYLVMPLLEGESLRRRLQREEKLDPEEARRVAIQVAQGLRYAHARGYLHRDIKPDNIWLTTEGDVILLDLGLARAQDESVDLTHAGTVLGTPCYMSPEQVQGKTLHESSDLFSLGVVLFEMLTGVSPFDRPNVFSTMMSVANDTLPIPLETAGNAIPSSLLPIVRTLLEKDPAARLQSADEVIQLLESNAGGDPGRGTLSRAGGRWNKIRYALVGAAAAALIGCAAWLIYVKTDKGTLVVRADPSVELKLADQSLTVRDPASGKEYTVRIGERPLPSGVYQLEMQDASNELVLTSNVITVRRGKTELVSIELRRDVNNLDTGKAKAMAKTGVDLGKKDVPAIVESAFKLADLPAIDAAATQRAMELEPGQPISPTAFIPSPQKLRGVDSWSVQPTRRVAWAGLSPDGKWIMSSYESMIYVWDESFSITHMLPLPGHLGTIHWSPEPNVLAVLCRGDSRKAIVWRLCDDHAEILQVIPVAASTMVWSPGGSQIAFRTEQGVQFYRLVDQQTYSNPNTILHGGLGGWSSDGRLFATKEKDSVNVWSLDTGQMIHVFPKVTSYRWLRPGDELLIGQSDETQTWYEVWNMSTMVRKDFFALPLDWHASTFVADEGFERFAVVTKNQQLVTGLVHGPKKQLDLNLPAKQATLPRRSWRAPKATEPPVPQLRISRDGKTVLMKLASHAALVRVDSQNQPSVVTPWTDVVQPQTPSFYPEAYRTSQVVVDRTSYDMQTGVSLSAQPFDLQQLRSVSPELKLNWSPAAGETGGMCPSPRGTYLALATGRVKVTEPDKGTEGVPTFDASSTIQVIVAATGETTHEVETEAYIQRLEWSEDERYLVLTSSNGADRPQSKFWSGRIQILDLQDNELRDFPVDSEWCDVGMGDSELQRRLAELLGENVYPISRVVGNRLLVPGAELVGRISHRGLEPLDDRISQREQKIQHSERRNSVYRYILKAYNLDTLAQENTIPLGYFCGVSGNFRFAKDRMVWSGAQIPTSFCEKIFAEEDPSRPSHIPGWQGAKDETKLHLMELDTGVRASLDSRYTRYYFRTSPYSIAEMPVITLSASGEFLCVRGPNSDETGLIDSINSEVPYHVLAIEKFGEIKANADADFVTETRYSVGVGSSYRPLWHHAEPVLAWHAHVISKEKRQFRFGGETREVRQVTFDGMRWYDARSKTVREYSKYEGRIESFRSMPFGWVVQDECSVLAFDYQGEYLGRWLDGSPPSATAQAPQLNTWIDAAGTVKSMLAPSGFAAVLLRGNRFTTTSLESFQTEFAGQLPQVVEP